MSVQDSLVFIISPLFLSYTFEELNNRAGDLRWRQMNPTFSPYAMKIQMATSARSNSQRKMAHTINPMLFSIDPSSAVCKSRRVREQNWQELG